VTSAGSWRGFVGAIWRPADVSVPRKTILDRTSPTSTLTGCCGRVAILYETPGGGVGCPLGSVSAARVVGMTVVAVTPPFADASPAEVRAALLVEVSNCFFSASCAKSG